jgi:ATP-dependent Clp protease ATP-binding subunit ClpC
MTSNLGARQISPTERGMSLRSDLSRRSSDDTKANEAMRNRVMDEVKKTFRPEFLNRIDEVIVFHPLTADEIFQIVDLMIDRVNKQVKTQEMSLTVSPEVKEHLAKEGFDMALGARPLRRAVQRLIEDPLAEEVLRGTFRPGDTIRAEMDGEQVVFRHGKIDEGLPTEGAPSDDTGLPPLEEPATVG